MSLWWIALTICFPLGPDSRDCARVVIHAEDMLTSAWSNRAECERLRPLVEEIVMAELEDDGWGAASIEGSACEQAGQVI